MAIVFVSPKSKQRALVVIISLSFVCVLIVVGILILLPELLDSNQNFPIDAPPDAISGNLPDIQVDLRILDSQRVINLKPFSDIETTFTYVVEDSTGQQITGSILAISKEQAKKLLEDGGFTIVVLEEAGVGRKDPFTPY